MPVVLKRAVEAKVLRHAKAVSFTVEHNIENWVVIYIAWGELVDGVFVEHRDPVTGVSATPLKLKIEDGCHPLVEGQALSKCTSCGSWHMLEAECVKCGAPTAPYDGFTRLASTPPRGATMLEANGNAIYDFITAELVPDPETGDEMLLLDAAAE